MGSERLFGRDGHCRQGGIVIIGDGVIFGHGRFTLCARRFFDSRV
jgi:hypothetical protein